ncbi:Os08g0503300 [Oryza sativa Japonica Group]|uniref:Os08g0503300 protein n=2 Tax=Oryza TaxID=4527 RepID=Q0J4M7_ORYSJ|nr:Os08g0503300 [Oryza sativa Japonica Group]|eukprot:NP_001062174.1 Os08g0503300 [Oryza sativa Japonica Group]
MFQMLPPRLAFSTRFSCGGGGGGAVVVSGERLAVDARRNDPDETGDEINYNITLKLPAQSAIFIQQEETDIQMFPYQNSYWIPSSTALTDNK